jgi:hypothetical protein
MPIVLANQKTSSVKLKCFLDSTQRPAGRDHREEMKQPNHDVANASLCQKLANKDEEYQSLFIQNLYMYSVEKTIVGISQYAYFSDEFK